MSRVALGAAPIKRTCARCGAYFIAAERKYACPDCRKPKSDDADSAPEGRPLTFRQQQIAELIGQGKCNKEIAYTLHLTEGTIKEYVHHLFRKTGVTNRTELALQLVRKDVERLTARLAAYEHRPRAR